MPIQLPEDVTTLAGRRTGRWSLRTMTSEHVVDLDAGTWERRPGDDAARHHGPSSGLIRTMKGATVGECLRITTRSTDMLIDYGWSVSTPIVEINRIDGDDGD